MSAEVKAAVDKLGRTFDEFKAANDERLAEIQKRGAALPETQAKVDKIDAEIEEMKVAMEAAAVAARKRSDDLELAMNRKGLGGSGTGFDEKIRVHAAQFYSARQKKIIKPTDKDLDVDTYLNYVDAFEAAVRNNLMLDTLPAEIRAAMSVGSDPDGGIFVPPTMSTEIERRVFDSSPMRQVARIITIGTDAWEAPYISGEGVSGGWVAERAARPATGTPTGGEQRIPVHEQYANPEVTQKMLDDAMINVEDFIFEETSEKMSRTENLAFISGAGVGQPRGVLSYGAAATTGKDSARSWGVLQYVPSGASGAFPTDGGTPPADKADALIDTIAALNPTYRQGALWAMNRTTEATVRKLKDRDGRYLVGFGDLRDAATGFNILNFPITNFEDMPDIAANSLSIAFGNFRRGYYIIDRTGFRLLRDPYVNKPYVQFYMTKRTGGDVRNFDAIKLVKFSAS